jgi:hypothetical protein
MLSQRPAREEYLILSFTYLHPPFTIPTLLRVLPGWCFAQQEATPEAVLGSAQVVDECESVIAMVRPPSKKPNSTHIGEIHL